MGLAMGVSCMIDLVDSTHTGQRSSEICIIAKQFVDK